MEFLPGFGFCKIIDVAATYRLQVKAHFTGPCASVYTAPWESDSRIYILYWLTALAVALPKTAQWQDEKWIYKSGGTKPPQRDRRYSSRVCLEMPRSHKNMSRCWSPARNLSPGVKPPPKYEIWVAITYLPLLSALLGAFAILRKATISFIMSVRLSFRPHGTTRLQLDGFSWNLIFEDSVKKIQVSLKSDKNKVHFTRRPEYILYHISLISSWNEKCFR